MKKYNFGNIRTINDNVIENKKYFSFINDNISISNINTNFNTNTFTNNNTFSAGPETPEIFENRKAILKKMRILHTQKINKIINLVKPVPYRL